MEARPSLKKLVNGELTQGQKQASLFALATVASATVVWYIALRKNSVVRRLLFRRFMATYDAVEYPELIAEDDEEWTLAGDSQEDELAYKLWVQKGRPKHFKLRAFNIPFIVTVDKRDLVYCAAARAEWFSRMKVSLGPDSIIFKHGQEAKAERQLMNKAFGQHNFQQLQPTIVASARRLRARFDREQAAAPDGGLKPAAYLARASFEVIADAMGVDHAGPGMEERVKAMVAIVASTTSVLHFLPFGEFWVKLHLRREFALVDALVSTTLSERMKQRAELAKVGDIRPSQDLLDVLINSAEDLNDEAYDEVSKRDWIKSNTRLMFVAATDTTGLLMEFLLITLAAKQDIQRKMKEEFRSVFSNLDEEITLAKLEKLKYTAAVIKECGRLYPVTGGVVREPDELAGRAFPKSGVLLLGFYIMHRDPEYFSNPDECIPERWIPEANSGETADNEAFATFSHGYRACLGRHMAYQEMKTFLLTLLHDRTVVLTSHPSNKSSSDLPGMRADGLRHVQLGYRIKFVPDRDAA